MSSITVKVGLSSRGVLPRSGDSMTVHHKVTREGDEMVCSCGLRWCVDENDPHPVASAKPSVARSLQMARSLRSRHGLHSYKGRK